MKVQHLLLCLSGIMIVTKVACAEEVNFGKKKPSVHQAIEAFSPALASPDEVGHEGDMPQEAISRSIDMSNLELPPDTRKMNVRKTNRQKIKKANAEAAVSMEIFFNYNSAELTPSAKDYLKPVGEAMASEKLQSLNFIVEGHTDAVGGYAYNMNLSEERAGSVKSFLVDAFHIEPSRIRIIGKGKAELLDPANPGSEVNRRVKIIAKNK